MAPLFTLVAACATSLFMTGLKPASGQLTLCVPGSRGEQCFMDTVDVDSGCTAGATLGTCSGPNHGLFPQTCILVDGAGAPQGTECGDEVTCLCRVGICANEAVGTGICSDPAGANGDPHLVGFKGQTFDFTGEDGGAYSLVNDGPCNVINMRVTALPGTPMITYITGLGLTLCGDDGETQHTVEIVVDDPQDFDPACPTDDVCLADGALTVLIDGEEMSGPGEYNSGDGVAVAAVNIPGQCRPFGSEKYWLAKTQEAISNPHGRQLREALPTSKWILNHALATDPTECRKYVDAAVAAGSLLDHQSEHTSFQITSSLVSLRVNHGKIHQVAMRDPTDTIDLPDHLAFQMNIVFNGVVLGDDPQGALGETVHPVLDEEGKAIMQGLQSIRGNEEDYRVQCLLCSDFSQLHHRV